MPPKSPHPLQEYERDAHHPHHSFDLAEHLPTELHGVNEVVPPHPSEAQQNTQEKLP